MTPKEKIALLKDFVEYCENALDIKNLPKVKFVFDRRWATNLHSFGRYRNGQRDVTVYMRNRNMADVLRTLAHELVHHKQNELGKLNSDSGKTGSDIENEANAKAGILMRNFGKEREEIYESQSLKLMDLLIEVKKELTKKRLIYKKPNLQIEWNEAKRYPEFKEMGKKEWIKLASKGRRMKYSTIKKFLGNVDLKFNGLEKEKKDRFQKAFDKGIIEMPIVVKFSDKKYDLIGGNTRLSGLNKNKIDPTLWVINLKRK